MGTTREDIKIFMEIHKNGLLDFTKKLSIADIGTSQLNYHIPGKVGRVVSSRFEEFENPYKTNNDFLKSALECFGHSEVSMENYHNGMLSEKFYRDLGYDYTAFDLDTYGGKDFVVECDLNEIVCPEEHRNRYDLVINHGTTEHLINQTNAFRLIHDLCKTNGIMVSTVPCFDIDHGLLNYSPVFFRCLAIANRYEMISQNLQSVYQNGMLKNLYVFSVLRKTKDSEFVQASQVYENGLYSDDLTTKISYPRENVAIII